MLYRNKGDGTFEDVSDRSGITKASGTYGLGASTLDFDDDGWVDLYVANDSNPSALYRNNRDGTFADIGVSAGCAYSQDGKPQAGMGVGRRRLRSQRDDGHLQDQLRRRHLDAVREHRRRAAARTARSPAASGVNTRWLGWGAGFVDLDNDGWLDLFLANGHVYPEVEQLKTDAGYRQRKVVYRNLGNGRFEDVTERLGPPVTTAKAARGAAFGDFDNDGDVDVVVNNVHDAPDLLPPRFRPSGALARRAPRRDGVEPQRDRRPRAAGGRRDHAGGGGARRRQLQLAERPARALRPRRGGAGWIASRCAGRTASRSTGPTWPSIGSTP